MASWPRRLIWLAAAVGLLDWLRLMTWYWPGSIFEGHSSGVWAGLADDFARGILYRPVLSGDGYGGTRYMPLFFLVQGTLQRSGLDNLQAGWLSMAASGLLLWLVLWALLRQRGPSSEALPLSLLVTTPVVFLRLSLELRCEPLACAWLGLALWFWRRLSESGRAGEGAGLTLALWAAVLTKWSSLYALPVALLWLSFRGKSRAALGVGAALLVLLGLSAGLLEWASQGRWWENLQATAWGGWSWQTWRANVWECLVRQDPIFTVLWLGALGLGLVHRAPNWPLLVVVSGVTLALFGDEGIWINHFLEPTLVTLLVLGDLLRVSPGSAGCIAAALVLAHALTWLPGGPSVQKTLARDGLPRRRGIQDLHQRYLRDGQPYFCENASVATCLGDRAYSLDEFTLKRFLRQPGAVAQDFQQKVEGRFFAYLVLQADGFEQDVEDPADPLVATCEEAFWAAQPVEFRGWRSGYQVCMVRRPFALLGRRKVP